MAGRVVIATGPCPKCGAQMVPTTYGTFCLDCGYTNYGDARASLLGGRISHRDVREMKDGKKRGV
jgi:hypothetical protein